jgi:hypothetical protein
MRAPPDAATETSGVRRQLGGTEELLPHHRAHAATQEGEVHHGQGDRQAADLGGADQHRVVHPCLALGRLQPLAVGPRVDELERIGRAQLARDLAPRALVHQLNDPLAGGDREVVAAVGAHPQVGDHLLLPIVRVAAGARVAGARGRRLGHLGALAHAGDVDADLFGH